MDCQAFKFSYCCVDLETDEQGQIFASGAQFRKNTFQRKVLFDTEKILAEFQAYHYFSRKLK